MVLELCHTLGMTLNEPPGKPWVIPHYNFSPKHGRLSVFWHKPVPRVVELFPSSLTLISGKGQRTVLICLPPLRHSDSEDISSFVAILDFLRCPFSSASRS